ncbi:stage II sporulation protein E [Fonticella tunisiensis]|uniref:Stage II sporulation protein E n=1 Tax=Fonticella tunisiensis TaxID=1096341 RepID=A0A4R7K9N3_9CLOT|nr:stage II sporulation protein E [Fonticella tunisiensis]TDT50301.1 stage II sporulation protein E [Fonticella tunisiensis]
MIYKNDIMTYKRSQKDLKPETERLKLFTLQHMLLYISVFFAARVFMLRSMSPFGIAFFTAVFGVLEKKVAFITGLIAIAGYLSSYHGYHTAAQIGVGAILMIMMFAFNGKNRVYKMSALAFISNLTLNIILGMKFDPDGVVLYDIIVMILESVIIVASSYIFTYAVPLYFQNKKRKILSKEELVCLSLIFAMIISGMPKIEYNGLSLGNMIALFLVLASGYTEGPTVGAASGAILGILSSISDFTMPVSLGIYAFCGLISGIFKHMGKFITAFSFILAGTLLSFYTAELFNIETIYLDTLIPALLFVVIPQSKYERLVLLIDGDKRSIELQKSYIERVKDVMGLKLAGISNTLSGLSEILEEKIDNELARKAEINGLVEKLADKVCAQCDSRDLCWKRELYYTYDSFVELLRLLERSGRITTSELPESLRRKCIRPNELIKQANHIFEIFKINNRWKKKLINSKVIVADQIRGISNLINSMMEEAATSMEFKNDIEEEIAVALDRKGLEFDDVLAIKNPRNKYEVTIYRCPCSGQQVCTKDFVNVISKTLGVRMIRDKSNCKISNDASLCQFRLVEAENYNVVTSVSKMAKENISGDSYSCVNLGEGRYMLALSDGMGSGAAASIESNATITLLEKFMEAGFERNTAIKAINSVLVLRSSEESFATIDMGLIDLYSGIGEFIKIGSGPTFIKSGMEVDVIKSTSLPVGILDEVDIESQIVEFKNGDMIVMVTDGVVDANDELKDKWIVKALKEFDSGNPKDVADYIINRAKSYYGDRIKDDMTVMVSKIWKVI